jgi:hypothetical protein
MLMYRTVLGRLKERQGRTWQEQRNTVSDVERVATTSRRLKEAFVEMVGVSNELGRMAPLCRGSGVNILGEPKSLGDEQVLSKRNGRRMNIWR